MLNRIILIGRLVADPQLRYTSGQDSVAVTNFRIAVDRPYTNQQKEREADFIDIVCWRKLAEIVANNLSKGRLVAIEGRLQIRQYEWEGQKRQATEVYADNVRFLDGKREGGGAAAASQGSSTSSGSSSSWGSGVPGNDFGDSGPDDVPF